ncbi:hypothetical protein [Beijerinckia indica]|uniref:hypothetical protein n=1 Tax=Beijerinckia indica TaxID=533 RepID=UPI0002EF9DEA|nr:hypothetical protein [Beijerinckia indica]
MRSGPVGDITIAANGGIIIQSKPEGGATANSFVIKNASAHAYTLSNGQLIDATTGRPSPSKIIASRSK